jgi:hypothetical protein
VQVLPESADRGAPIELTQWLSEKYSRLYVEVPSAGTTEIVTIGTLLPFRARLKQTGLSKWWETIVGPSVEHEPESKGFVEV